MDEKELDKMAKDIEPIEEPKEVVKTQNSDGFVEDKETYVKPDGETTTSPVRTPNVIKEESGKGKWVFGGLATILILGLGASSTWLYMDAQNVRNELQSVKTGLDAARSDAAKLRTELTEQMTKIEDNSNEAITDSKVTESDETLIAGEASAVAEARGFGASPKITTLKVNEKYAKVSISGGQTTYNLLLKKASTNGHWVSLWIGPDAKDVPNEVVDDFAVPTDFTW